MKTVAICQARMGSTRLPGKVMKDLRGRPLLRWTIDALQQVPSIDQVVLATSTLDADHAVAGYCIAHGIPFFRGSESDVLDRFYQAAFKFDADIVLRFTCDCPFIDPYIVEQVIKLRLMTGADYASNCYPPTFPDGLDTECFTFAALAAAHREAVSRTDRDCLTQFIVRNGSRFKAVNLSNPLPGGDQEHWVCDSADDFKFCDAIASRLSRLGAPSQMDILNILHRDPELRAINSKSIRNERFYEAISEEQLSPRTFERSRRVFERASKVIPTGANTFSKSHLQFPAEGSPLYASHGDGAYIFDVDGNRYVDLVNALLPCVLGYRDPDVDFAVRQQLDNGVVLSLGTELETKLAETLCRLIPCAEMVKFGKTGTDVTTAAVRLARAYTGRNHIFLSGYSGWADWSMCRSDRRKGIPEALSDFTHMLPYGETSNISAYWDEWAKIAAAVIVEPVDDPNYLNWVREWCTKHGVVLIFDEIRTGFRYDMGGAQKLYGVTPDLACFGKAMANGMPISALVGKREIMKLMETPDVYYSGTFFGETLSIAAALATIKKMEDHNVVGYLCVMGSKLEREILRLIHKHGLADRITLTGWYTNQTVEFRGAERDRIRTMFMQVMFQQGVLIIASNNLSYAIKAPEMKRILTAYDVTLEAISSAIVSGSILDIKPTAAAPLRMAS